MAESVEDATAAKMPSGSKLEQSLLSLVNIQELEQLVHGSYKKVFRSLCYNTYTCLREEKTVLKDATEDNYDFSISSQDNSD